MLTILVPTTLEPVLTHRWSPLWIWRVSVQGIYYGHMFSWDGIKGLPLKVNDVP